MMKTSLLTSALLASALTVSLVPKPANACGSEPYLGSMCVFAGNFAPRSHAFAQGQILSINQNQSLFSIFGTTYGGDGRTTFGLPDLRGRSAIGYGQGPGLSNYSWGQKGGLERVTLSSIEIPSHTHAATTTVNASIDNAALNNGSTVALKGTAAMGNTNTPTGNALAIINQRRSGYFSNAAPDVVMANEATSVDVAIAQTTASVNTTVLNSGGSQAHENRSPYIVMNWIITLQGLFPPRN